MREGFLEGRAAELAGSSIGDWLAMALLACGANESYDAYLAALERHVTECYAEQGTLDALMATEYSRTILTVSMLGGDPSAFGTRPDGTAIDLLNDGVWNFAGEPGAQGLNGLIFALLAVDAGTYPEPERAKNTRAGIVEAIRAAQEPDGGFGLVSGASEADLTAMALRQHGHQDLFHDLPLAEDDLLHLAEHLRRKLRLFLFHHAASRYFDSYTQPPSGSRSSAQRASMACSVAMRFPSVSVSRCA